MTSEKVQLVISVGGSKCAFAIVGEPPLAVLARSERVEWTQEGIVTICSFVRMLVREIQKLLTSSRTAAARIKHIGIAWPGPGKGREFSATFIPGCDQPQPISDLLRAAMIEAFGSAFKGVPIRVVLDAFARLAGESGSHGALAPPNTSGMLVNIATGIAGGLLNEGQVQLTHPLYGENYGQFGRFLFFNRQTKNWRWAPTLDGRVPTHEETETRWTDLCAGPAIARRIAMLFYPLGVDTSGYTGTVAAALRHYENDNAPRNTMHEMVLLRWASAEAKRNPKGLQSTIVEDVAWEIGAALATLRCVFAAQPMTRIVLAGGVGEHLGLSNQACQDEFLRCVQNAFGFETPIICRAQLGVDAEFLGLASNQFQDHCQHL